MSQKRDYYEVLDVPRGADDKTIKRAYRELAMKYHPDRNPDDPAAEESFKEATEAYTILSSAEKRRQYDRAGHAAFDSSGGAGFDGAMDFGAMSEIFEGLFGDVFGGRRQRKRGGRDMTYELEIDFVEAALGAEKTIRIERPMPCVTCTGTGAEPGTEVNDCAACRGRGVVRGQRAFFAAPRACVACGGSGKRVLVPCEACTGSGRTRREDEMVVRIPAGVDDGAVRTVRGAGEIGTGSKGDLHVTVRVADHPLFERNGPDVLCTVPVSFPQAVLGGHIEVPTLAGKVKMKLPEGTQSGRVFRLRGKGIDVYGGVGKGDQLVTVLVEVPEKISKKQRKLIEELATELGTETHPQRASFLGKLKALFE